MQHQQLGPTAIVEAGFGQLSVKAIFPTCELKTGAFADGLFDLLQQSFLHQPLERSGNNRPGHSRKGNQLWVSRPDLPIVVVRKHTQTDEQPECSNA
ncbi:hypothetical protein D9M71_747690 [compost metagenome]